MREGAHHEAGVDARRPDLVGVQRQATILEKPVPRIAARRPSRASA